MSIKKRRNHRFISEGDIEIIISYFDQRSDGLVCTNVIDGLAYLFCEILKRENLPDPEGVKKLIELSTKIQSLIQNMTKEIVKRKENSNVETTEPQNNEAADGNESRNENRLVDGDAGQSSGTGRQDNRGT